LELRQLIKLFFLSLGLLLISVNIYAFNLVGVWKLTAIDRQTSEKIWATDTNCFKPTGLIIYTASGYMSAGVNCMNPKSFNQPSFSPGNITFYMGKYIVKHHKVIHISENASNQDNYQKQEVREFHVLNKHKFMLIIKNKDDSLERLTWEKVAVN
jgi:hypothetical protein